MLQDSRNRNKELLAPARSRPLTTMIARTAVVAALVGSAGAQFPYDCVLLHFYALLYLPGIAPSRRMCPDVVFLQPPSRL